MSIDVSFEREIMAAVTEADPKDLITKNMDTAIKLAGWFSQKTHSVPLEELQAEALLTLVEVVREHGERDDIKDFKKYASALIIKNMKLALTQQTGFVLHWRKRSDAFKLKNLEDNMSDEEMCAELGWTQERLRTARQALFSMGWQTSLQEPITEDGKQILFDVLADPGPGPEEIVLDKIEREEERSELVKAIDDLSPVTRNIISLRCGIPVPNTEKMALRDVLQVGADMSGLNRGIKKLREAYSDGNSGKMVPDDYRIAIDGHSANTSFTAAKGQCRALDIWHNYANEFGEAPPNLEQLELEPAGEVGNSKRKGY